MTNQPPTPPAVTDEMVEAAITEMLESVMFGSAENTIKVCPELAAAHAKLLALIARARTPETATPVPGRLHAAAQALVEFNDDETTDRHVWSLGLPSKINELRAALAAAPTPAATDAGVRVAKCGTCGDSGYITVGSSVPGNIGAHSQPCPACHLWKRDKMWGKAVPIDQLPERLREVLAPPAPAATDAGLRDAVYVLQEVKDWADSLDDEVAAVMWKSDLLNKLAKLRAYVSKGRCPNCGDPLDGAVCQRCGHGIKVGEAPPAPSPKPGPDLDAWPLDRVKRLCESVDRIESLLRRHFPS